MYRVIPNSERCARCGHVVTKHYNARLSTQSTRPISHPCHHTDPLGDGMAMRCTCRDFKPQQKP